MELRLLLAPAAEEQNALVSCSHGDRKSCNLADGMGHLLNVVITARPSSCLLRHWTVLRAPEVKQLRHIHVRCILLLDTPHASILVRSLR